jgi:ribonuclease Z
MDRAPRGRDANADCDNGVIQDPRRRIRIARNVRCTELRRGFTCTGLPLATAVNLTRLAHTVPEQMGKILDRTRPRMAALWHLDLTPGVDTVFDELGAHYQGPMTVTQDLTVFNVTEEAVVARQAKVSDAAPPVHGPSKSSPALDPMPAPPAWWPDALLDV